MSKELQLNAARIEAQDLANCDPTRCKVTEKTNANGSVTITVTQNIGFTKDTIFRTTIG